MIKLIYAFILALMVSPVRAQTLATISGTSVESPTLTPDSWIKIGSAWGPSQSWQFGFDSSKTGAVCAFDGVANHQKPKYIVGPCRDFFILAKNGRPIYHVGLEFLGYDVSDVDHSHPYYLGRAGIAVGPAIHSSLTWVSDKLPYLENIASWSAPKAAQYLGNIATFDIGGGPGVGVKPVYGGAMKLTLSIDDVMSIFK